MTPAKIIAVRENKTVFRDGDRCLKVFDETFSKSDVLNEALNQSRVEETDLHIPKLREISVIDGKWAIIMDYIEGRTLAELMKENPAKRDEYLELFVNLQIEVHGKSCPLLSKLLDKMHRKVCLTDYDANTRYEMHARLDGMPKHNKLCHGDFNPSNVIIATDGTPYILDWSHATQGNASADAARSYLLFCLHGENEAAKQYLDLFCAKSLNDRAMVQKWLPIVAASQSVKKKEKEREFLAKWVHNVDFG